MVDEAQGLKRLNKRWKASSGRHLHRNRGAKQTAQSVFVLRSHTNFKLSGPSSFAFTDSISVHAPCPRPASGTQCSTAHANINTRQSEVSLKRRSVFPVCFLFLRQEGRSSRSSSLVPSFTSHLYYLFSSSSSVSICDAQRSEQKPTAMHRVCRILHFSSRSC